MGGYSLHSALLDSITVGFVLQTSGAAGCFHMNLQKQAFELLKNAALFASLETYERTIYI